MTGARFALLTGDGARLERALINFMLDLHTKEHGYTEVLPPFMVNARALFGTGQLPKFEDDLFKVEPGGYYLVPTAEVPVTNIHAEEILDAERLPIAYCAYTPCFRSEAGSYGKDVRGLIRQHQFDKVELVRFAKPEDSYAQLEALDRARRGGLEAPRASLPRRRPVRAATWATARRRPTTSRSGSPPRASTARSPPARTSRPTRRAAPTSSSARAKGPRPTYVHTLNGSGLAVGRTLVAILENGQQADGSVITPEGASRLHGRQRPNRARAENLTTEGWPSG